MSETYKEKLSRVRMMASERGGTWDLSDNDCAALSAILKRLDQLRAVCDEVVEIMEEYDRQEAASGVDTPGGLEHMGDVWRLLRKWETQIKKVPR